MTSKYRKNSKLIDRIFRELFMGLVTLAVMLIFILSMHLFMGIALFSKVLWSGSIFAYLAINLILDVKGIGKKVIVLGVSSVIMGIFFNAVLNWDLIPSLLTGMVILMLSILLYMTFLH